MTITPPRGTTGTRNRRRRPQLPGEPRHAAGGGPASEEAPAPRRRSGKPLDEVRPELPAVADGLGARLYQTLSDSERETAVAETLLFVKPAFDEEEPPGYEVPSPVGEPGYGFGLLPEAGPALLPEAEPVAPAGRSGWSWKPGRRRAVRGHRAPEVDVVEQVPEFIAAERPVAFAGVERPLAFDAAERPLAFDGGDRAGAFDGGDRAGNFDGGDWAGDFDGGDPVGDFDGGERAGVETILFARFHGREFADRGEDGSGEVERPVRRDVSPMTETFLFGAPARQHAQEPRSPIDGAAETLLFAGLARAMATADGEPVQLAEISADGWHAEAEAADVIWDMPSHHEDGVGWAPDNRDVAEARSGLIDGGDGFRGGLPYRESVKTDRPRSWVDLDRNAPQPRFGERDLDPDAGRPGPKRGRDGFPEQWGAGAAGIGRPGRVVNRKRSRAAQADQNVAEGFWNTGYPQDTALAEGFDRDSGADYDEDFGTPEPVDYPVTDPACPDAELVDYPASGHPVGEVQGIDADGSQEFGIDESLGFGAEESLSPERLAKAAASEAAWRAFSEGDREPGAEIRTGRRAKSRWMSTITGAGAAPEGVEVAPKRPLFVWPVLLRCLLYLGPLSVAIAGIGALGRVAWPVPAATLLLGWAAAQALTSVGVTVTRRAGAEAAVRLVGAGFAAMAALWCALVWITPAALLGPDRLLAAAVGLGGLATLATVTAALVTRAEAAVICWYLPCWLLAGTAVAAAGGAGWAGYVPVETLLPAGVVAVLIRAFRPAVLVGKQCRIPRLTAVERRRAGAYLVIGAAQAICVALLWQAGPAVTPAPAALPLLLAVPLLEALIGWHTNRIDAGLDSAESPADLDRHVRNVTVITLAGLLPPLAAGAALALASYQLPHSLTGLGGTQDAVLALSAGTLLGGVFAITFLLAARSRTGIAAALATAPPLATLALPLLPQPAAGPLPIAVAVLAATHVAGLLIVALTAADLRRTP
ncbi:hypothetical protein [Actinoplanes awajinensis]|nr:hypothetical protein [Actinoplanes awajinensis]